jgi:hypothetical protein
LPCKAVLALVFFARDANARPRRANYPERVSDPLTAGEDRAVSRNRYARLLLAALALSLLAAAVWQSRRPPADLARWDEARLARELEALGFKTAHVDDGVTPGGRFTLAGRYFARPADPRPWAEIANLRRDHFDDPGWEGTLVALPRTQAVPLEDTLQVGPFTLYGDPAELGRVAAGLGVPR